MTKPSIPLGLMISQSGSYQIVGRETLKGALMAIDEINESTQFDFSFATHLRDPGGVASAYHDACAELIRDAQVDHIVGCYTSASRKQVIPIVEQSDRLLWHPARYEGFESSENVIYVGAAPNHTIIPLIRYMLSHISDSVFCVGSNYVWTWETNRVMREIVTGAGGNIVAERLIDLGDTAMALIIEEIIARQPPVILNTLVGESSYAFIRALHQAFQHTGLVIPMLSCSLCEPELKLIGSDAAVNCITSSSYFEGIQLSENIAFVDRWKKRHGAGDGPSVDSTSIYVSIMLLARAIRRAGTADVPAVRLAAADHRYESPQGPVWVDADNHHCFLTPRLARSAPDNRFEILWEAETPERPDPYLSRLDLEAIGAMHAAERKTATKRPGYLQIVK